MYHLLGSGAKERTSFTAFREAYRSAGATATIVSVRPGKARNSGGRCAGVPVTIATRIFGVLRGTLCRAGER